MYAASEETRGEIARILEAVATDGLPHPRNLDAALDAIFETLRDGPNALWIPALGTRLKLAEDWAFPLHNEYRNEDVVKALVEPTFVTMRDVWRKDDADRVLEEKPVYFRNFKVLGPAPDQEIWDCRQGGYVKVPTVEISYEVDRYPEVTNVTIPAGTVLIVDRIYIRKGLEEFNSVTFRIDDCPDDRLRPKKRKGQFKGQARFWAKLKDVNGILVEAVS